MKNLLSQAQAALGRGRLPEAESLLRRMIAQDPDDPRALHLLGLIAHRKGEGHVALERLRHAAEVSPDHAEIRSHLAEVLRAAGQANEAAEAARRAVTLAPDLAAAHNNLGLALADLGRLQEAVASFRRAIAIDRSYSRGHFNLGNTLRRQGKLDPAESSLREALRLQPKYSRASNALGIVLGEKGDVEAAAPWFEKAWRLAPRDPSALLHYGGLLGRQRRYSDALSCIDEALRRKRDYPEAWLAKASVLYEQERFDEELDLLRQGSRACPTAPEIAFRIGQLHLDRSSFETAAKAFRRALEIREDHLDSLVALAHARAELCDWEAREKEKQRCQDAVAAGIAKADVGSVSPYAVSLLGFGPAELLALNRSRAQRLWQDASWDRERLVEAGQGRGIADRRAKHGDRLKIGYLSPDFRNHAVAHLMHRLFALHDRDRFEVVGYSLEEDDGSDYRRQIVSGCDRFVDLTALDDGEAARRLSEDGVQILVDLAGFARGGRPGILARRPAPIQVAYMYPGTMGGVFHDYFLGDATISPPSHHGHFGEKVVVLPRCYLVTDPRPPVAARRPERAQEGLPEQGFVFCCFNKLAKIEPRIFDVWMLILEAVPGSVLWLLSTSSAEGNLRREAAARGVDGERLCFAELRPKNEHLARLPLADLFLDTLDYNAHTTAVDSLWSGVPVVTCPGETMPSRVAASLLVAAGLPELVTEDLSTYEQTAIDLARNEDGLTALRQKLTRGRATSELFDTPGFAEDLEIEYLAMWQRFERREGARGL